MRRHPGRNHILDKLRTAEMLGREYSEWNGDEDTAQSDELFPAARRTDLFSKYPNSGDKIDKPGKTHPEIRGRKHQTLFREGAAA
jgi:hypothetical protein